MAALDSVGLPPPHKDDYYDEEESGSKLTVPIRRKNKLSDERIAVRTLRSN